MPPHGVATMTGVPTWYEDALDMADPSIGCQNVLSMADASTDCQGTCHISDASTGLVIYNLKLRRAPATLDRYLYVCPCCCTC